MSERWRAVLPSVQRGFSSEFVSKLEKSGGGEYICELASRRGGFVTFRILPENPEPLPAFPGGGFEQFSQTLPEDNSRNITPLSLQSQEHSVGSNSFPTADRRSSG